MKLLLPIGLFFSLTRAVLSFAAEEPTETPEAIHIEAIKPGSVQWEFEKTNIITITDEFLARYKGARLTAKRGEFDTKTGEMTAEGAVNLEYENQVWRGERLHYNFFTRHINTEQFRTGRAPFYATGGGLTANPTNNTYTATNAFVSTDDVEKPGFRIRARR